MKKINLVIIFIWAVQTLFAQYNLSPDTPINPVPVKFHKDHFFLKGNIEAYKRTSLLGKDTLLLFRRFDEKGFLVKDYDNLSNSVLEYSYKNNKLKGILYLSGYANFAQEIILDDHNRPVAKKDKEKTINQYEYDSKGNLIKEFEYSSLTNKLFLHEKYTYDAKNRLTKLQRFDEKGNTIYQSKYLYQKEGDFLKIKEVSNGKTKVSYYQNGFYCGNKPAEVEFDKHGNPVSCGKNITYYNYYYNENRDETSEKGTCISGDCENGWGSKEYKNGSYTGFFENGVREGYGAFKWNTGEFYEGQWKNDKRTGLGIYVIRKDNTEQGEFLNGKLDGMGLRFQNTTMKQGIYSNGELITSYSLNPTGQKEGCINGDCQEKYGIYVYDNGDRFMGFWKNGKMNMGYYFFSQEDYYFGYFNSQGQYDRYGFLLKAGNSYFGEWKNGKYHGKGYLKTADGNEFAGIWENGKLINSLKK